MQAISRIRDQGIPVVLFDSPSPDPGITSIGNDFSMQGQIAAERLVTLIGGGGKVAVMQGYPTAPNHKIRYEAQTAVLKKHPHITIVDGGIDGERLRSRLPDVAESRGADGLLDIDAIADTYWHLHTQHRSAWTQEIDLRPFKESF